VILDYYSQPSSLKIRAQIQNKSNRNRSIQIRYSLPIKAKNWWWGDDVQNKQLIEDSNYQNVYPVGKGRLMSKYP
jgi:hypothetical protein